MTENAPTGSSDAPPTRASALGKVFLIAIAASAGALSVHLYSFALSAYASITYPFGIDYAEGIVWRQLVGLLEGTMYSSADAHPYIVYHYTPIYHAVTSWLVDGFGSVLSSGRTVSLLASLLLATLIGVIVAQTATPQKSKGIVILGAAISGLTFFAFKPVFSWAALIRVDMLGLFFEAAGLALFFGSLRKPKLFYLSAALFVLAVYTKQSIIIGASAAFAVSFVLRFGLTLRVFGFSLLLGGVPLVVLTWVTDGEFLRHIFQHNINRVDWSGLDLIAEFYKIHGAIFVLSIMGLAMIVHRSLKTLGPTPLRDLPSKLRAHPRIAARLTLAIYLAGSILFTFAILKSGANHNYLLPLTVIASILVGLFVTEATPETFRPARTAPENILKITAACLVLLFSWQTLHSGPNWRLSASPKILDVSHTVMEKLRTAQGPIWSEDLTLALLAQKEVIAEPATMIELATLGTWDQRPFLKWFEERRFALVVTLSLRNGQRRYTPEMASAIRRNYPHVVAIGPYWVHYPTAPDYDGAKWLPLK